MRLHLCTSISTSTSIRMLVQSVEAWSGSYRCTWACGREERFASLSYRIRVPL